ncbi:C-type lectin domain family 2 member G-like, partial [Apodemus sylvaticus]|uniref:C-type lectin domain family 2 member G-like n=1 Tax=Apodemus sylvaticus TaxID=10129 RepID=UPI002243CA9C
LERGENLFVHNMNAQCLQKPGEDNGSPGTGAVHCYKIIQRKSLKIVSSESRVKYYCCCGVILVLIATVVALSGALPVRTTELISSKNNTYSACPSNWTLFETKCFYFSETSSNWTSSQNFCMAQGAQLARFDNLEELTFLNISKEHYWIGLYRESTKHPWRWTDNTEYNHLFSIRGDENYGFLSDNGISSSRVYIKRKWICSKSVDTLQSH